MVIIAKAQQKQKAMPILQNENVGFAAENQYFRNRTVTVPGCKE
jgi:hypothetical protein